MPRRDVQGSSPVVIVDENQRKENRTRREDEISPPSPPPPSSMALRRRLLSLDCPGGGDDDLCHNSPPPTSTVYVFLSPHNAGTPHSVKKIIPISASLLTFAFILFSYYMACHWYPTLRRRRRPRFIAPPALPPPQLAAAATDPREDLLAVVADGGEPYHVWLIKTKGLDEKTIGAISVCTYKKKEGVVEGSDCTICLGEFVEGESLRVLPNCSHAFHLPCIDTWLRSHVNCPLCRAPVVSPPCVKGEEASNSLDHVVQLPAAPDPAQEVVRAGSSSSNTEAEVRVMIEPSDLEDRTTRVKLETLRRSVSVDSGFGFMSMISGRACGL